MDEWRDLAERLVEVNLAIENLDGWVTRPEDVEDLKELEALRDAIQAALASGRRPRRLRRRLAQRNHEHASNPPGSTEVEPRD